MIYSTVVLKRIGNWWLMKKRRDFLKEGAHACAVAVAAGATGLADTSTVRAAEAQKYLLVGLVGSENPTRANFPFVWAAP